MGLSSKEVSSDHHETDWSINSGNLEFPKPPLTILRRQQQQQSCEVVKCPRCESTNTKFCYYNNYNKTQPRHFCKTCKRHWTNGGTLRNVPVGGGRKYKRLKRPNQATTTSISTSSTTSQSNLPQVVLNEKDVSKFKMLIKKPIENKCSATEPENFTINIPPVGSNDFMWDVQGRSMNSTLEAPHNPSLGFNAYSSLSSFDPVPSFLSTLNCSEGSEQLEMLETKEDSTITSIYPSCASGTIVSQPWEGTSSRNSFIDLPDHWNWNMDDDTMVLDDLNIAWDDSQFDNP